MAPDQHLALGLGSRRANALEQAGEAVGYRRAAGLEQLVALRDHEAAVGQVAYRDGARCDLGGQQSGQTLGRWGLRRGLQLRRHAQRQDGREGRVRLAVERERQRRVDQGQQQRCQQQDRCEQRFP